MALLVKKQGARTSYLDTIKDYFATSYKPFQAPEHSLLLTAFLGNPSQNKNKHSFILNEHRHFLGDKAKMMFSKVFSQEKMQQLGGHIAQQVKKWPNEKSSLKTTLTSHPTHSFPMFPSEEEIIPWNIEAL
jgi:hypothetical protein